MLESLDLSSNKTSVIIKLNEVLFAYPGESGSHVINIPNWQVNVAEHVFVVGSSGSGKSTLLSLLSGLTKPDSGQIMVSGSALETKTARQRDRFRATEIGYVAQSFNLIPYLSALENIQLALFFATKLSSSDKDQEFQGLLNEINVPASHWRKPVSQLSIGQQQRVAIARAIVNKPKLLIADEPTSSLDQSNRDAFMSMLMRTAELHNMTLVFVSHDLSLRDHFHRVDSMSDINQAEAQ